MIEFYLDAGSGLSPYQQLVRQVRHALRLGLLREGDQLPTVKDVVAILAINPNTVLKAYRELEHDGLVVGPVRLRVVVVRMVVVVRIVVAVMRVGHGFLQESSALRRPPQGPPERDLPGYGDGVLNPSCGVPRYGNVDW